jgi:precorrin-2 methylase
MLVAECSFNFSELMEEPELEPLSEDVVATLQQQAEVTAAAELQAAAEEGSREKVSEAAAAIASAFMSMGEHSAAAAYCLAADELFRASYAYLLSCVDASGCVAVAAVCSVFDYSQRQAVSLASFRLRC